MKLGTLPGASVTLKEWWAARPRLRALRQVARTDLVVVLALSLVAGLSVGLVWEQPLNPDAGTHLLMAESLATNGTLQDASGYSHFYPPAYPALLALPGKVFGFTREVVHAVQGVLLALLTASAFFVARTFGRKVGLVAAALTAFDPALLVEAGQGRATLLAALLLLWTLHFVLKGIANEAALGWAAVGAALLYLTKDTTGYVAVLGIGAGFLWRVRLDGLTKVLRSAHYRLAGAFFMGAYFGWAARNLYRFGSPTTNPSLGAYSSTFFGHTDAGLAASVVVGTALLFALRWFLWVWPALVDPRSALQFLRRGARPRITTRHQAVAMFVGITLLVGALMTAIFIRNEGNKAFPGSVPDYYRLAATADPILFACAGLWMSVPRRPSLRATFEAALDAAKVGVIAAILLAAWPGIAAGAHAQAVEYEGLQDYLWDNHVWTAYSEASFVLAPNLPRCEWLQLHLDFSGPFLNFTGAGIPDRATLVTVGSVQGADFWGAGFAVILHFNSSNPPVVRNPFYEG